MPAAFDPMLSFVIIMLQVGNKYLRYDVTKAQEKILMLPHMQLAMYFCIMYFYTKSIPYTIFIVVISTLLLYVLLNENSRYHILPKSWLYEEKLIDTKQASEKEVYKNNLQKFHS
jgi:hypothetical protein